MLSNLAYSLSSISTGLSESDVLDLVPPGVTYCHQSDRAPSAAATISEWRRTPVEVVKWDNLLGNADSYRSSNNPVYEEKDFEFQRTLPVSIEKDLERCLLRMHIVC